MFCYDLIIEADTCENKVHVVYSDYQEICDSMSSVNIKTKTPSIKWKLDDISEIIPLLSNEESDGEFVPIGAKYKTAYHQNGHIDIYNHYDSVMQNAKIISGTIPPNFNNEIHIVCYQKINKDILYIYALI